MPHILQGTWDEIKTREPELSGHQLLVIVDPAQTQNADDDKSGLEGADRFQDFGTTPDCCALRRAKLLDALSW
jgi:hypothetical protein